MIRQGKITPEASKTRTINISVVFQGQLPHSDSALSHIAANIKATRDTLPDATIILSTWRACAASARKLPVDAVVLSDDPGSLPNFKYNSPGIVNNVNRQIVSSAAGLAVVKTPYAIKLRTDCRLKDSAILDSFENYGRNAHGSERILVPHLFSVDPRVFEQLPLHLSDWMQFGPTAKVCALWAAPLMSDSDARYYDSRPHAPWSSRFDKRYRARFAAEQHIWRHYAGTLGYICPDFHNDIRDNVLEEHDRFVAQEVLVIDTATSGLVFDRYNWALHSGLQKFNCINSDDWLELVKANDRANTLNDTREKSQRIRIKKFLSRLARSCEPIAPILQTSLVKPVVSYFLKMTHTLCQPRSTLN